MTVQLDGAIGDIVAADLRAAGVFERFGIDYCCGGRRSLSDACRAASADEAAVVRALDALPPAEGDAVPVADWPLDRLIDYIVEIHHAYVRSTLPAIAGHLEKLRAKHGSTHPELDRVAAVFDRLRADLDLHMRKEEQILFPYVHDLVAWHGEGMAVLNSPFGTVANPIRMMEHEHDEAADAMREIRALTNDYTPPADGCTTYQVCLQELTRFERDLHRHVHLENNVLFPRAVRLERGG